MRFIQLLNSDRGIQSKLSKSIGKSSSYFSEVKRGKPVNALHLKAVELICGAEKLAELMAIDNFGGLTGKVENAGLKVELLSEVIWAIDQNLESQGRALDAKLKAKAIGLLYLHFMESEKSVKESQDTIKSYLKLVA